MVDNSKIDDLFLRLTGSSIHVYCVLCRHANKDHRCWPSISKLQEWTGVSAGTVKRAIAELQETGAISIESGKDGGTSNVYTINSETSAAGRDGANLDLNAASAVEPEPIPVEVAQKCTTLDGQGSSKMIQGCINSDPGVAQNWTTGVDQKRSTNNTKINKTHITRTNEQELVLPPQGGDGTGKPKPLVTIHARYCELYREKCGINPVLTPANAGLLGNAVKRLGYEAAIEALENYFHTRDDFVISKVAYSVQFFYNNLNRWRIKDQRDRTIQEEYEHTMRSVESSLILSKLCGEDNEDIDVVGIIFGAE